MRLTRLGNAIGATLIGLTFLLTTPTIRQLAGGRSFRLGGSTA